MTHLFKGLTWDHPRGYAALDRAGRDSGLIAWDKHPLEGFESAAIGDLCARYDLVVLDHPHLGEALAAGCLQPLEAVFDTETLARIEFDTIGPCLRSYEMDGRHWALPLDAASQVMALRPDRMDEPVETWADVADMARLGGQVALSLAGPHALLTLLSIAAAFDDALDLGEGGWLSDGLCQNAYDQLREVFAHSSRAAIDLNPIGILERMSGEADIDLCPLIYGNVNYSARPTGASVFFRNAPRAQPGGRPGSILGGTGIGISTRCRVDEALRTHLQWLMSAPVQSGFIPTHHGQPSARAAWMAPEVNRAVRGFYLATAETLERATLRPRHNGYIRFQTRGSAYLRAALADAANGARVAKDLAAMFQQSLPDAERMRA